MIIPRCETSACSQKPKAAARLTAAAWMRWDIYGMLNGEGAVLSVTVRMGPPLLFCGMQSTCPALAGEGFTRLYCTTASVGLTALSEYDGTLLKAESDVSPGLPENRFAAHPV